MLCADASQRLNLKRKAEGNLPQGRSSVPFASISGEVERMLKIVFFNKPTHGGE
jgi:hypothetical protein